MTGPEGDPSVFPAPRAARAFGLDLELDFDAPGLSPRGAEQCADPVRVRLATPAEIDEGWEPRGGRRILVEHFDGDLQQEPARTIDLLVGGGYRLFARHFGTARISADGREILCTRAEGDAWSWQRFLVGRVLPWAAVLRGLEVFHASAVAMRGRYVVLAGETGLGKTSLALRLTLAGAAFVTDDVLAVDLDGERVIGHPGAGLAAVRDEERRSLSDEAMAALGAILGHSGKTYLEVPPVEDSMPLGVLYFLRGATGGKAVIEPVVADPRMLLGSTFVLGVQEPARLSRQLDICARIAAAVPTFVLRVLRAADAGALAERVHDHAMGVLDSAG